MEHYFQFSLIWVFILTPLSLLWYICKFELITHFIVTWFSFNRLHNCLAGAYYIFLMKTGVSAKFQQREIWKNIFVLIEPLTGLVTLDKIDLSPRGGILLKSTNRLATSCGFHPISLLHQVGVSIGPFSFPNRLLSFYVAPSWDLQNGNKVLVALTFFVIVWKWDQPFTIF